MYIKEDKNRHIIFYGRKCIIKIDHFLPVLFACYLDTLLNLNISFFVYFGKYWLVICEECKWVNENMLCLAIANKTSLNYEK